MSSAETCEHALDFIIYSLKEQSFPLIKNMKKELSFYRENYSNYLNENGTEEHLIRLQNIKLFCCLIIDDLDSIITEIDHQKTLMSFKFNGADINMIMDYFSTTKLNSD